MVGTTIAQYRILKKIGQGGMGEVYLANDSTLKRRVALKFLPSHLKENPDALARFLREAESAASLEHPYICNIKELSQTDDGQQFIVMEYVEGQTLKERIEEGLLPIQDAVRIAVEVVEALEIAHEQGIIHRDLKPSNIMLTPQDHAKVMDFGLAKRVTVEEGRSQDITRTLTKPGSTLGTLAYMSPEQLKGSSVDVRSDIFSFGIVLYEMLTGKHPFRKGQTIETASNILTADPEPLTNYRKEIPEQLEQTVLKMLARNPEDRFESVREIEVQLTDPSAPWAGKRSALSKGRIWGLAAAFLAAIVVVFVLTWWTFHEEFTVTGPKITSIAVLPLTNRSGDPEQDFFVDGMTEALITDLSKIGALKVIARSSSMIYKGSDKSLSEIARELKVDALVEGSVVREENRVGITAQLIEASTGTNLWADRFERNLVSILSLQGEIASAIAREIQVTLTPEEEVFLSQKAEVNPEAYEAYLKGTSHLYRLTPGDLETALKYFKSALEIDPEYASAYVGIAMIWIGRRQMTITLPSEANPFIREAIQKAFELDDSNADAYYALALEEAWGAWDWVAAEKAFKRTLELDPNHAEAHAYYAHYLMLMKQEEEAMSQMKLALQLDPQNQLFHWLNGVLFVSTDRFDETIELANNMLRTQPNNPHAWARLLQANYAKGLYEEAYQAVKMFWTVRAQNDAVRTLELGYEENGFPGAMLRLAVWEEQFQGRSNPFTYAAAGKLEKALDALEQEFELHDPNLPYIGMAPVLDTLHQEPRFREMLTRLNFPDEVLEKYLDEYDQDLLIIQD